MFRASLPQFLIDDLGRVQKRALSIIYPTLSYDNALTSLDLQSETKLLRHCTQIGLLRRTKESAPLPCSLHSKLGCLLCSIGSSNIGTTLQRGDGGGKAIFPPFEVSKN